HWAIRGWSYGGAGLHCGWTSERGPTNWPIRCGALRKPRPRSRQPPECWGGDSVGWSEYSWQPGDNGAQQQAEPGRHAESDGSAAAGPDPGELQRSYAAVP